MYHKRYAGHGLARSNALLIAVAASLSVLTNSVTVTDAAAQQVVNSAEQYNPSIIRKISGLSEKLELTSNTTRILTLEKRIPRVQVNNPELLDVTPLSDRELSVSAKRVGITQINLWDEDGDIHTVDVLIYGDAKELEHALQIQFPHSSLKVYRYSESLVLGGFVDRPDYVSPIMRLAEDYAPKVINNIAVGGVQQILLNVKVMEVSRTKLRRLGADFAQLSSSGAFVGSSVSGMISTITQNTSGALQVGTNGNQTFQFGIVDGNDVFFGFLDALQQNNIAKILAEPSLVAVSGRPAQFNSGGEIPILVPQSLGTASIEYKKFGTQIDFLPIVLGDGKIRLEVRPRISQIDQSLGVRIDTFDIPALKVREADTAVEMRAGQTFAIAGLIEQRIEGQNGGLPWLADIPVFGAPFRRVQEELNEIELLILVTPEFVDAMDPHEVPCGIPGGDTVSPTNDGLYCGGHMEVPPHCNPIAGPNSCVGYGDCPSMGGATVMATDGSPVPAGGNLLLPGGTGYDEEVIYAEPGGSNPATLTPPGGTDAVHGELALPPAGVTPRGEVGAPDQDAGAGNGSPVGPVLAGRPIAEMPNYTSPRPYSPNRAPVYLRNSSQGKNQHTAPAAPSADAALPAMIGPVGYDVQ